MKLNWNFLGGMGVPSKNLAWGSMDIFLKCSMVEQFGLMKSTFMLTGNLV